MLLHESLHVFQVTKPGRIFGILMVPGDKTSKFSLRIIGQKCVFGIHVPADVAHEQ